MAAWASGIVVGVAAGARAQMQSVDGGNWVARSNAYAMELFEITAHASPEGAGRWGVVGYDEAIVDVEPAFEDRSIIAHRKIIARFQQQLATETDPRVAQDLKILIDNASRTIAWVC